MNPENDPDIAALFGSSPDTQNDAEFTHRVVSAVRTQNQRRRALWWMLDVIAIVVLWLLAEPLQAALTAAIPWLFNALIPVEDSALGGLLYPVNNLASAILLAFLRWRSAWRALRN